MVSVNEVIAIVQGHKLSGGSPGMPDLGLPYT